MGSGNMALSEGLLLCLVGVAVGQFSEALLETSTPVPILRYIDSQNADGSYTYGFEGADGTYKIETRLADGQCCCSKKRERKLLPTPQILSTASLRFSQVR